MNKSTPNWQKPVKCLLLIALVLESAWISTTAASPAPDGVKKNLAPKPPLGWNSYDSYRVQISEEDALQNLEVFAKKLAPHGYEYFVIDYGWYCENACVPGSLRPWGNDAFDWRLNEYGFPVGSRTYFPGGMKRIADRAHQLGVKFGLHMMRGMIRKAWEFNLPVKGTPYHLRDIADTNNICHWANYTYGVDMKKPGAQEYYDTLIQHLADLGVDFIKYDDLVPFPDELEAIGKAVAKCKRDIVLSLSPGDDTTPSRKSAYQWGHLLRITGDIWDSHQRLDSSFKRWRDWQGESGPGFWPDMDMLCIGTLTAMIDPVGEDRSRKLKPAEIVQKNLDEVYFRPCRFTQAQERTFLTLRALSASPLFMGGCLVRTEPRVLDLITDKDFLACDQNGISGTLQSESGFREVWRTPKAKAPGQGWVGIFNRNQHEGITGTLTLKDLGLPDGDYHFRNVWTKKEFTLAQPVAIAPDDVRFLHYELKKN